MYRWCFNDLTNTSTYDRTHTTKSHFTGVSQKDSCDGCSATAGNGGKSTSYCVMISLIALDSNPKSTDT